MSMTMPDVQDAIEVSDALFAGPVDSDPTPEDAAAAWAKLRDDHDDMVREWNRDLAASATRLQAAAVAVVDACGPATPYSPVSVPTQYGTVVVGRSAKGPHATLVPYPG